MVALNGTHFLHTTGNSFGIVFKSKWQILHFCLLWCSVLWKCFCFLLWPLAAFDCIFWLCTPTICSLKSTWWGGEEESSSINSCVLAASFTDVYPPGCCLFAPHYFSRGGIEMFWLWCYPIMASRRFYVYIISNTVQNPPSHENIWMVWSLSERVAGHLLSRCKESTGIQFLSKKHWNPSLDSHKLLSLTWCRLSFSETAAHKVDECVYVDFRWYFQRCIS